MIQSIPLKKKVKVLRYDELDLLGVGTSGSERCHLHEDQAQDALDRPVVDKTTTSGPCVFSNHTKAPGGRTHLRSQRPLRVLCLTPTYRSFRLEWCHARGNWTAADWKQVVLGDESRFSLSSDGNHVSAWRPREEHLNPAFAKQ
ncbi:uncharacterized protein TNCV_2435151 [Trichonephila clavipes]|nr:uncharacterized protein TNCV_2435151 [Trichonephila clavipes]